MPHDSAGYDICATHSSTYLPVRTADGRSDGFQGRFTEAAGFRGINMGYGVVRECG